MSRIKVSTFNGLSHAYEWLNQHINYERSLNQIRYDTTTFEVEAFRELMRRLGDPQRGPLTIHIAGTRGKGSSALMLEALLRTLGLRVATYTSPHLREYRERIRIDAESVSPEGFCRALEEAIPVAPGLIGGEGRDSFKTVFEYLTAAFFLAARHAKADVLVVETGLGGRLDATNILDSGPVLLTRIGLEHTQLLGETIPLIAAEKAAILKPGGWAVAGQQLQGGGAPEIFTSRSKETGSPLIWAEDICPLISSSFDPLGMELIYRIEGEDIQLNLPLYGPFIAENIQGVLAMMLELDRRGLIPKRDGETSLTTLIADAFQNLVLPGRMEPLGWDSEGHPRFIVDGAHCPTGARAVADSMRSHFGGGKAIAVVGMMSDKDHPGFFKALSSWPGWCNIICYNASNPRAASAEALFQSAKAHFPHAEPCPDLSTALELALKRAEKDMRIVAFGSIYSIAPIQDWIRLNVRKTDTPQSSAKTEPQSGSGDS